MTKKTSQWVEFDLCKNGQRCVSLRGEINSTDLNSILENKFDGVFFKLVHTHWLDDQDGDEFEKDTLKYYIYGQTGSLIGLDGTSYLRVKDIREISLLTPDYGTQFKAIKSNAQQSNISQLKPSKKTK